MPLSLAATAGCPTMQEGRGMSVWVPLRGGEGGNHNGRRE